MTDIACKKFEVFAENQIFNADLGARATINNQLTVDNIKHHDRQLTARWDSASDVVITGNFASNVIVDSVLMLGLKLSSSGAASFYAYSGENQTGDIVFSETNIAGGGYKPLTEIIYGVDPWGEKYNEYGADKIKILRDEINIVRSFKIVISDTGSSFIDLRHLMIGKRSRFENNYDWGDVLSIRNSFETAQTGAGMAIRTAKSRRAKNLVVDLSNMSDVDRIMLSNLERNYADQAWYVFGKPWEAGLLNIQYEFLAIINEIKYAQKAHGTHNAPLELMEV